MTADLVAGPPVVRHPYRFVAALEGMILLVYLAAGTVAQISGLTGLWLYAIANTVLTLAVAVILTVTGRWQSIGFRAPRRRRDLLWFVVPFLPVILNLVPGLQFTGAAEVTGLLLLALMVGFVEESVFRGLMLTALRVTGVWRAIIVTSVLFGLTHLANVLAGATVLETVSQVVYTIAFGVAFAALVLRTGMIWPLVLAHAAIDAAYFLQVPGFALGTLWTVVINLGATVGFGAYGIIVIRRGRGCRDQRDGGRRWMRRRPYGLAGHHRAHRPRKRR